MLQVQVDAFGKPPEVKAAAKLSEETVRLWFAQCCGGPTRRGRAVTLSLGEVSTFVRFLEDCKMHRAVRVAGCHEEWDAGTARINQALAEAERELSNRANSLLWGASEQFRSALSEKSAPYAALIDAIHCFRRDAGQLYAADTKVITPRDTRSHSQDSREVAAAVCDILQHHGKRPGLGKPTSPAIRITVEAMRYVCSDAQPVTAEGLQSAFRRDQSLKGGHESRSIWGTYYRSQAGMVDSRQTKDSPDAA